MLFSSKEYFPRSALENLRFYFMNKIKNKKMITRTFTTSILLNNLNTVVTKSVRYKSLVNTAMKSSETLIVLLW